MALSKSKRYSLITPEASIKYLLFISAHVLAWVLMSVT